MFQTVISTYFIGIQIKEFISRDFETRFDWQSQTKIDIITNIQLQEK